MTKDEYLLQTAVLRRTASVLRGCGYLETQFIPSLKRPLWKLPAEIPSLFGLTRKRGSCFNATAVPGYLANRFIGGRESLKTAHVMFFMNMAVPEALASDLLTEEHLEELIDCGAVNRKEGMVQSRIRFVPWDDYLILSDPDEGAQRNTDYYVYAGGDSTLLIDFVTNRLKPEQRFQRGLDLCAGTSIQSYNLLNRCDHITAAELNPRAVRFAKASSEVNQLEKLDVIQSDLWQNVQGRFDIILSNPPYLPMPGESVSVKTLDVCGGGALGLDIPLRIIDGLGEYLDTGGYSAVLAASPVIGGENVLVKDLEPLAAKHGLSIHVHAWKYTNLKLDLALQRQKGISHFVFCVIETHRSGTPGVKTLHMPIAKRVPQIFYSRLELLLSRKKSS